MNPGDSNESPGFSFCCSVLEHAFTARTPVFTFSPGGTFRTEQCGILFLMLGGIRQHRGDGLYIKIVQNIGNALKFRAVKDS